MMRCNRPGEHIYIDNVQCPSCSTQQGQTVADVKGCGGTHKNEKSREDDSNADDVMDG